MTPEAQRLAIAKFCGFTNINPKDVWVETGESDALVHTFEGDHTLGYRRFVPDYPNCLNAMAEAEIYIDNRHEPRYYEWLDNISHGWDNRSRDVFAKRGVVSASSAVRAEAFLRTLGLWDDSWSP